MPTQLRKSGIEILGDIPWGSHFCQFYETKEDLLQLLVPYFKTGLENNEYCLWITCEPISREEAITALREAMIDFDSYLDSKGMEFFCCRDWFVRGGRFDEKLVYDAWTEQLQHALSRGYEGMRVNCNETWLNTHELDQFMEFERSLNSWLHHLRMIIFCTYPLKQTSGGFFSEVAHAHEWVISRRKERWEILETPELKIKKAELVEQNRELDALVTERTNELAKLIEQLKEEIEERKKAEEKFKYEKDLSSSIIESIPGIFELYDRQFRFVRWNKQFELVSGYTPDEIRNLHVVDDLTFGGEREKRYNILKKIYETGRDEGEVTITVKDGRKIPLYFVGQLINYEGEPCYICSAIDITERKRIEENLKSSYDQIRSLSEHLTSVREQERKHIAREIHDELGQELTVLKMDVGSLVKKIPLQDEMMRKRLASFSGLIDNMAQSVRRIASELRPSLLDDLGLPAAIAWHLEEFEKHSGAMVHFNEPKDEWILPDAVKINLFRIVQEATTNIGRHSKATEVHVNLERNDHSLTLEVNDNGVGFHAETISKENTLGILGMKERASILGGNFEIKSVPGKGTGIFVSVPLPLSTTKEVS